VVERGEHFGLPLKPCQSFRIAREHLQKNLNSHIAVQLSVFGAIRLILTKLTRSGSGSI
jgi:hypothetical protein